MPYYPETTVIKGLVRVVRERHLPSDAMPTPAHVVSGDTVEAVHTVLQGDVLREYRILDAAEALKMRDASGVAEFLLVEEGDRVKFGQELARRGRGRRMRVLRCPTDGQVIRIEGHRLIIQVNEQTLEVQARIPGDVESAGDYAVKIAGTGALLQCAWGNGQFFFGNYRFLPENGFVGLSKIDVHISEYRNVVVVSKEPVSKADLLVAQQQEVAGVIAPSMSSNLRNFAMQLTFPLLLTEGFGQCRPTGLIYNLLESNLGRQAAFNAAVPDLWEGERPEIMIPLPSGGMLPPTPELVRPLQEGDQVRVTRAPWAGQIGDVAELPEAPQTVQSGLRLPSARVRLENGAMVTVPLANLDLLG